METCNDNSNVQTSTTIDPPHIGAEHDHSDDNNNTGNINNDATATVQTGMNPQQHNYEDDTNETPTQQPPAAPTKPQLRRRLFEKLRTKRNQIITQHQSDRNNGSSNINNNFNTSDVNNNKSNETSAVTSTNDQMSGTTGTVPKKRQSLVTHYYRVDTVPRKTLLRHQPKPIPEEGIGIVPPSSVSGGTQPGSGIITSATKATIDTISQQQQPQQQQVVTTHSTHNTTRRQRNQNNNDKNNSNGNKVVNVILPGVPTYEEDWARDTHDYFNLIVLVPVTVLNIMNWNWDILLNIGSNSNGGGGGGSGSGSSSFLAQYESFLDTLESAWTGDWFDVFFYCTAAYFIIDLLWIIVLPICVKSPSVIIQHHTAVLLYIIIPFIHPDVRYWMGACMSVEINTWFLIARRVFNKQGFPPWTLIELNSWLSIRVKVISIFFYLTWISIRCILYPALLYPFYKQWLHHTKQTGTVFNLIAVAVILHAAFCLLNLKWSYELLMSKIRYFRRQRLQYKQHLRQNRNNNNNSNSSNHHSNGKLSNRYQYQPDPSASQGL